MADLGKKNVPENILSAWSALEILSPPKSFKHPRELVKGNAELTDSLEKGSLPWETRSKQVPPGKTPYYQVVLGTVDLKNATLKLSNLYLDKRIEQPQVGGEVILAVVVVDKDGCVIDTAPRVDKEGQDILNYLQNQDGKDDAGQPNIPQPASVSSFAWGVPQALKGDLSNLNKWDGSEKEIVSDLCGILRKRDGEGKPLVLSRGTLDEAYDHLVTTLGLTEDLVKKNRFAIKTYMGLRSGPPEPLIQNSFFLRDLALAKRLFESDQATKNLRKYLGVDVPSERHNLLRDDIALEKAVAPSLMQPARWPGFGRHPLVLLQQAAVNLAIHELKNDGIIAVNGPPGTGKTTLLRDIVAAVVTQRAEIMCDYDDPEKAFFNTGHTMKVSGSELEVYALDKKLKGFEVLIASANNKAAENISAELPVLNAIAQDAPSLRYFSSLSDKLLNRDTWGLISAVLGNLSNCKTFCQTFWWQYTEEGKEVSMARYLAEVAGTSQKIDLGDGTWRKPKIIADEKPPVTRQEALKLWHRARSDFQKALKDSKANLAKLEEIRQQLALEQPPSEIISSLEKELNDAIKLRDAAINLLKDEERKLQLSKSNLKEAKSRFSSNQAFKPNWFLLLFNIGSARLWYQQDELLYSKYTSAEERYQHHRNHVNDLRAELVNQESYVKEIEARLKGAQKEGSILEEKINDARAQLGNHLIDKAFFSSSDDSSDERELYEKRHKTAPWYDEAMHRARDEVFIAAMKLHKAFIDVAAIPLRHNLGMLMRFLSGYSISDEAKAYLFRDLWASLFLVVPTVSTTFASVERMLGLLPPESLGWLLIDEAGQVSPQAAVGALLRAKRAVVVGDPIQIEPVVLLQPTLTKAICKEFNVDPDRFNAPEASVQTLADSATPYFARFEGSYGRRSVGIPLLVHRRCSNPMFSIANVIGYDNLMINAKQKGKSKIRDCLFGASTWIDIRGKNQDKWCPEEGKKVLELLHKLKSEAIVPDLYIVTIFSRVAIQLRDDIIKTGVLKDWVSNPAEWVKERIGTAHTMQGREAEVVIFVLGAPLANQEGARNWAGKTPNLLNVSVTRAKEALYIIGNYDLWQTAGVFSEVANKLKVMHSSPTDPLETVY